MATLTDRQIKNLKPDEKDKRYSDGLVPGLQLLVKVSGRKSWVQRIQFDGKRRDLGLGSYPEIGLADARERGRENRYRVAQGLDPISGRGFSTYSRRVVETADPEPDTPRYTFESEYREWHSENAGRRWKSAKQCAVIIQRAENHLFPNLGDMPIDVIEPRHLMQTLLPLRGVSDETVERLVGYSNRVFGRAIALGRAEHNPAESMRYVLPPREQQIKHRASLHYSEVGAALDKIDHSTAYRGTKWALRFMALTVARGAEVRGARWDEIDCVRRCGRYQRTE